MPFTRNHKIDDLGRECSICREYKEWKFYNKSKGATRDHTSQCKKCLSEYYKRYRKTIPKLVDKNGRECSHCGEYQLWAEYGKCSKSKTGKNYRCKSCRKKRYEDDPLLSRKSNLKRLYGITYEEFLVLKESQMDKCAICKEEETRIVRGKIISLSVDHCHTTGKVRGLLCSDCNVSLGKLKEDKEILTSMINYIEEHKEEF